MASLPCPPQSRRSTPAHKRLIPQGPELSFPSPAATGPCLTRRHWSFTSPAAPQLCNLDGGGRRLLPHLWPLCLPRSVRVLRCPSRWQV